MNLNCFPDLFVDISETEKIRKFMNTNKAPLYIIRDGVRAQSPFHFFSTFEECLGYLNNYQDIVIIAVSVNAYKNHKVILGTIELTSDNWVSLTASTSPECDHRSIFEVNDFNVHCSILEKSLRNIPEFDTIYTFLVEHSLIDVIVEYTIYDIPVGHKNEKLVIQEIRHY